MTPHSCRKFDRRCGRCWLSADELIGSEWDDKDQREADRRIQITAVRAGSDDGYGGPVYDAITIQSRQGWKIGRRTQIGAHGLRRRWREADTDDFPDGDTRVPPTGNSAEGSTP